MRNVQIFPAGHLLVTLLSRGTDSKNGGQASGCLCPQVAVLFCLASCVHRISLSHPFPSNQPPTALVITTLSLVLIPSGSWNPDFGNPNFQNDFSLNLHRTFQWLVPDDVLTHIFATELLDRPWPSLSPKLISLPTLTKKICAFVKIYNIPWP